MSVAAISVAAITMLITDICSVIFLAYASFPLNYSPKSFDYTLFNTTTTTFCFHPPRRGDPNNGHVDM